LPDGPGNAFGGRLVKQLFSTRSARLQDRELVRSLLVRAELPLDGVHDGFPDAYVVACVGEKIAGVAGLEQFGSFGLLRSVAVDGGTRGQGVGRALVSECMARARTLGLERVFLLTTTAPRYFEALGFVPASREEAPDAMRASPEFSGVCPSSAICMARRP
ncbi:MAG TPA: arsenic resistance N-acetyltransferase ArsN2, partial [Polyangiaceae bacterium]